MSKNILIVSASPRKGGNSDLLCDEFMRGAGEAGHDVKKIRLSDKDIKYCTGCCSCIGKQGACVQKDDMNEILEMVLAADVMVLASPVYFHSMNGQMKTFIDRVCPIYSMIRNKDVYLVLAAAGGKTPIDNAIKSLRLFTDCLSSVSVKDVVSITGVWDAGKVIGTRSMTEAYELGKNV